MTFYFWKDNQVIGIDSDEFDDAVFPELINKYVLDTYY